jgi:hypothetical protein
MLGSPPAIARKFSGKARASATDAKRNNASLDAGNRETSACTNDAGAALEAWIEQPINSLFESPIAIKMFFV